MMIGSWPCYGWLLDFYSWLCANNWLLSARTFGVVILPPSLSKLTPVLFCRRGRKDMRPAQHNQQSDMLLIQAGTQQCNHANDSATMHAAKEISTSCLDSGHAGCCLTQHT
jgi:hypothetical protein